MNERIFIIDDQPSVIRLASDLLDENGYSVESATNPIKGLEAIQRNPPDLILLDVRMPQMDGFEVCRKIKSDPKLAAIPVLILSARSNETDVAVGLEIGADDYIYKPVREKELIARVRTAFRRTRPPAPRTEWKAGPLALNLARYVATADGKELPLRGKEFELLAYFVKREGEMLTRETISKNVWGMDLPRTSRTIDFYVHQLRKKLGAYGSFIKNLKGVGYRFEVDLT
jgi:DNA-binding response OmpR family regulator